MKKYVHLTPLYTALIAAIMITAKVSAQATVDSIRKVTPTKPEEIRENIGGQDSGSTKTIVVKPRVIADKKSQVLSNPFDSAVESAYSRSMEAYYYAMERKNISDAASLDSLSQYNNWALKNRKKVIEQQQVYAQFIFVLVIIIVLSGLTFSALQFRTALKHSRRKGAVADTTLKASLGGIEVSSSILGVIILTLSIVFFYLYLTKVYPVVLVN